MSEDTDPIAAIRQLLLADPDVSAIANDRVRALALHDDDEKAMPQAVVVLKPGGGPGARGYLQHGKTRVLVVCYGATFDESYDLDKTIYPLLNQLERVVAAGVLIHSVTCESRSITARDPHTQWPTTYSSYLVFAAEQPAA